MDNNLKIVGPAMPDMPWEDRPAGSKEVMWRYSALPSCLPQSFRNHAGWEPLSGCPFGESHVNSSGRPL